MHSPSSACEDPPFDLKHREVNHAVVNFATRESGASDTLKFCPIPVEIAERLALRPKRRRKTAHLPDRAYRQYEGDCLPVARLGLRHDPRTLGHVAASSVRDRASALPFAGLTKAKSSRNISNSLRAFRPSPKS